LLNAVALLLTAPSLRQNRGDFITCRLLGRSLSMSLTYLKSPVPLQSRPAFGKNLRRRENCAFAIANRNQDVAIGGGVVPLILGQRRLTIRHDATHCRISNVVLDVPV
jgi:hypothetical protein